jgi:N-acetylmuramoyl-L-alanine amidase
MVLRALCIDYTAENSTFDDFSDSSEDWQAKVVNKASELGLITKSNSTFRPNDMITRAEALKMVMQAAGAPTSTVTSSSFSDVDASSWVARYTEAALGFGIIAGNPTFRPSDSIKRGESTKLIMRSLFVPGM